MDNLRIFLLLSLSSAGGEGWGEEALYMLPRPTSWDVLEFDLSVEVHEPEACTKAKRRCPTTRSLDAANLMETFL